MANIAERLKELRTEAGLKQEELGEMIGVQRMTSYRWENGSNPPSNENLLLLTQLFNTSTLYLRDDIDDRDMVLADDWEEAKELLREADEDLLLGVYRLLSPEMKRFVQPMTRNALDAEREKEKRRNVNPPLWKGTKLPLFRQALKNRKRKAPPRTWTSVKAAEMLKAVTPEGSPGRENYDLGIPYSLFIASDEMTHCLPNLQTS